MTTSTYERCSNEVEERSGMFGQKAKRPCGQEMRRVVTSGGPKQTRALNGNLVTITLQPGEWRRCDRCDMPTAKEPSQ